MLASCSAILANLVSYEARPVDEVDADEVVVDEAVDDDDDSSSLSSRLFKLFAAFDVLLELA